MQRGEKVDLDCIPRVTVFPASDGIVRWVCLKRAANSNGGVPRNFQLAVNSKLGNGKEENVGFGI